MQLLPILLIDDRKTNLVRHRGAREVLAVAREAFA
jgi:hypothetical protein